MAKKLSKVLLCTALIGSAVAGGMALYNKYKASSDDFDDDFLDFDDDDDDFDDDIDDDSTSDAEGKRGYTSIPRESEETSNESEENDPYKVNVDVKINSEEESNEDESDL